ncbi:hypothetical protein M0811_00728 [Anaeramoeba ignava]|uniref:Probable glycerol kinase n=1 Tax=Anaeramoeba ignava TaxID=1746090 RepID=A0A9Q0LLR5_ANAIG|nr:hypothetical protein M0811_00728 [Anaeramoeba ignava]|eukprot:Anaeramoba_ignava/a90021_35.p1 GENE.a90021_35~~a90021_35.p1  ORF type:complete len:511 (+),score=157.22 a90021_35:3-1535(+)
MSQLVGAIDQGTTSTRFLVFNEKLNLIASHQMEFEQINPKEGWTEHDPLKILETVQICISESLKKCKSQGYTIENLKSIGITNQRETTCVWDKITGKPLHNAIVWLDMRNQQICNDLIQKFGNQDHFKEICGLPISTYFSATKLNWLIQNVPEVKTAIDEERCLFGTIDSWLIWNLTGGNQGGNHVTDVTNASRTMLMDLKSAKWSEKMCESLNIPMKILPKICSSCEIYGNVKNPIFNDILNVPIAGCLGDQQAALVGQLCFSSGQVKNTYGTGCFMLKNTGTNIINSTHGLLTTVAYQFGPDNPVFYALEGSVAVAGHAIQWLRDKIQMIDSAPQIDEFAAKVKDSGDVYFVPAFSGLFCPYWRSDARGIIVGLTSFTNKYHLARACLESTCFQAMEVLKAMEEDSEIKIKELRVDGGMTKSDLCMQIQADLLGINVIRPSQIETTALGAALSAGLGVKVWDSLDQIKQILNEHSEFTIFSSKIDEKERKQRFIKWKKAVEKSFNWID